MSDGFDRPDGRTYSAPVAAPTRGQAAYAVVARLINTSSSLSGFARPWDGLDEGEQEFYDHLAAEIGAAQEQPAPGQTPGQALCDAAYDALKSIADTAELIFGDDVPPVSFLQLKAFAAVMEAEALRGLGAIAAPELTALHDARVNHDALVAIRIVLGHCGDDAQARKVIASIVTDALEAK